jgi:hypothetical protein
MIAATARPVGVGMFMRSRKARSVDFRRQLIGCTLRDAPGALTLNRDSVQLRQIRSCTTPFR